MITLADISDAPALEAITEDCFNEMRFTETRGYVYDSQHILDNIAHCITSQNHILTKCEHEGQIIGYMSIVMVDETPYSRAHRMAVEMVWHTHPAQPPMVRARHMIAMLEDMHERVKAAGCQYFQVGTEFSGSKGLHRMLGRKGFLPTCLTFTKEV